ncbi:MAG: transposase [Bryobacteraceae bacterium]|nr:transposase [Bryobacteraceae bacterium]
MKVNVAQAGLRILAYCLMDNHIHLVCVPEAEDSLAICLRRTHGRYAQYLNARKQRSGHLWQNRFYSCPLDEKHLWTALRYVELNPVRAGLVELPQEYLDSSAGAHLGFRKAARLLDMEYWRNSGAAATWAQSLEIEQKEEERRKLRRATYAGAPLGSQEFVLRWKRPVAADVADNSAA